MNIVERKWHHNHLIIVVQLQEKKMLLVNDVMMLTDHWYERIRKKNPNKKLKINNLSCSLVSAFLEVTFGIFINITKKKKPNEKKGYSFVCTYI